MSYKNVGNERGMVPVPAESAAIRRRRSRGMDDAYKFACHSMFG